MPAFTRNGVRLWYEREGSGFPLVLHTGGAGSGSMWRDGGYVERLAEFQLLLLDHRGRGSSDRPATVAAHRIEEYVADVTTLVDAVGVPRYGFVGYSFGGAVGLRLAARDPRLAGLVALGAVYEPPDAQPEGSIYEQGSQQGMAAVVEAVERSESIELESGLRRQFLDTDPEQFRLTLAALAGQPDPWDELGDVRVPVLLVAGTDEDPDGMQDVMAATLPRGSSVHLAGSGHVGAFLRAGDVVAAALPLLRSVAGTT